jgi:3-hydroxymyristoyl/3-hydroxydecanoyl-(acyl carrier protein) dehydratase
MIDRIEEIKYGDHIKAVKCVTLSEDIFNEHFPGYPIFPGSLLLEGLAQLSGALFELTLKNDGKPVLRSVLSIVNRLKFRKPIVPGDKIQLWAKIKSSRIDSGLVMVRAEVDEAICAEGEFTFTFHDILNEFLEKNRNELYESCMKNTRIIP